MEAKTKWIIGGVSALALGILAYVFRDKWMPKKAEPIKKADADKLLDEYNKKKAVEIMRTAGVAIKMQKLSEADMAIALAREKEIENTLLGGGWILQKPTEAGKGYTITAYTKA